MVVIYQQRCINELNKRIDELNEKVIRIEIQTQKIEEKINGYEICLENIKNFTDPLMRCMKNLFASVIHIFGRIVLVFPNILNDYRILGRRKRKMLRI